MKLIEIGTLDAHYQDRDILVGKSGHWADDVEDEEDGYKSGTWIMDEGVQFPSEDDMIKKFYFASVKTSEGMSDKEFIQFLWSLLWDDISDGITPSDEEFQTLRKELNDRGIIDGEFPA